MPIEIRSGMEKLFIEDGEYSSCVAGYTTVGTELQSSIDKLISIMKSISSEKIIMGGLSLQRLEDFTLLIESITGNKAGDTFESYCETIQTYPVEIDNRDGNIY